MPERVTGGWRARLERIAAGEAPGSAYDPDHAFEFGLRRVLDGMEVLIQSRSS
jgi:hypothetical protein